MGSATRKIKEKFTISRRYFYTRKMLLYMGGLISSRSIFAMLERILKLGAYMWFAYIK